VFAGGSDWTSDQRHDEDGCAKNKPKTVGKAHSDGLQSLSGLGDGLLCFLCESSDWTQGARACNTALVF
jgi:hypothetical protein